MVGAVEICGNGIDDDFNGFADCADTGLRRRPLLPWWVRWRCAAT